MAKLLATYDLTVIGGGIIGLATARQVALRHPKLKICVLEKEKELASHQSKRNSGVVHCGIYYKRGSMKSKFCIKGSQLIEQYCQEKNLPYLKCGKLIVATAKDQLETLNNLFENATANRIKGIEKFNNEQILRVQPECKNAIEAIWSANTACVNWQEVAKSFASDFELAGGKIMTDSRAIWFLTGNKNQVQIPINDYHGDYIETRAVVNCAGLFSDYFARVTGNNEQPKVVPFKGNYFMLSDRLKNAIKTNIYPVPDPKFPFLGVHITPRVDGSVLLGPTSKLMLNLERYDELYDDVKIGQFYNILFRSGVSRLLRSKDFLIAAYKEHRRNTSKKVFAREVAQLFTGVTVDDLVDTKFCGIRAQVMQKDGRMVDDFIFETGIMPQFKRILHVRNCPSPAATSSMAIAERVVSILEERILSF